MEKDCGGSDEECAKEKMMKRVWMLCDNKGKNESRKNVDKSLWRGIIDGNRVFISFNERKSESRLGISLC